MTAGEKLYLELGEPSNTPWARLPDRLVKHFEAVAQAVIHHHLNPPRPSLAVGTRVRVLEGVHVGREGVVVRNSLIGWDVGIAFPGGDEPKNGEADIHPDDWGRGYNVIELEVVS